MPARFCVFCGSSPGASPLYADAAAALARELAAKGIAIVYGGGSTGLMGILADTALAAGGEVIGVIPGHLVEREVDHKSLTNMRIVGSMHERKALMAELSQAFIALPGGYGTFEEFCEVLTWSQLGLHAKPCGLLNVGGYYDRLLDFFDHAVAEAFVKPVYRNLVIAEKDPDTLISRILEYESPRVEKWPNRNAATSELE